MNMFVVTGIIHYKPKYNFDRDRIYAAVLAETKEQALDIFQVEVTRDNRVDHLDIDYDDVDVYTKPMAYLFWNW